MKWNVEWSPGLVGLSIGGCRFCELRDGKAQGGRGRWGRAYSLVPALY